MASTLDFNDGAKPPSSPTEVLYPFFFKTPFKVWNTSTPQRSAIAEALRAYRHHHELLKVDVVIGVRSAVEDVHHRHRQHATH